MSLIESLNNGLKKHALKYEGGTPNYIWVNMNKNSDRIFELSQSNLAEKNINCVGNEVSTGLKAIEIPSGKPLL